MVFDHDEAALLLKGASKKERASAANGAKRWAFVCLYVLAGWLMVSFLLGLVAGYSFTYLCYEPFTGLDSVLHSLGFLCKDGQVAPQMSRCEKPFCGLGEGAIYMPANVTSSKETWVPKCTSGDLLTEFTRFSAAHASTLISFRSRPGDDGQETVDLKAWWLPAPGDAGDAPRIMVQHGNNVDFNDNTVMLTAYMLRSMGFSVLVPNLRHHGVPPTSPPQKIRWSYDLFLDVLGAWDYAVQDPGNLLGGPAEPKRVGVMGVSMGGLAALTAFGHEPEIPAVWLDAAVFDPQDILQFQIELAIPLPIGPLKAALLAPTGWFGWKLSNYFAGADIGLYTPQAALEAKACSNSTRHVKVVQGMMDGMVPPRQSEALISFLKTEACQGNPYNVSSLFKEYSCGGKEFPFPTHVQMHTWRPDLYRAEMCSFWSEAFGMDPQTCGLSALPTFPGCQEAVCDLPP